MDLPTYYSSTRLAGQRHSTIELSYHFRPWQTWENWDELQVLLDLDNDPKNVISRYNEDKRNFRLTTGSVASSET